MERFEIDRLKWTALVPNSFYVYELTDPKRKLEVIKYGRTQNKNPDKRYSLSERKKYKMKLLFKLRGELKTMTKIENWWKNESKAEKLFLRFSEESFHGLSETIRYDKEIIERFIQESTKMSLENL